MVPLPLSGHSCCLTRYYLLIMKCTLVDYYYENQVPYHVCNYITKTIDQVVIGKSI